MNFIDSAKLEAVFGRWPTFHDAEVSRVSLDRSGANGPTLDMAIHVFEMTNEVDAEGVFVLRHHTEVTQRFDAIEELKLEAFNGQNVLAGLEVSRLGQHEAAGVACVGVLVLRDGSRVQVRERECRGGETVHPAGLTESRARGGRFMRNVRKASVR